MSSVSKGNPKKAISGRKKQKTGCSNYGEEYNKVACNKPARTVFGDLTNIGKPTRPKSSSRPFSEGSVRNKVGLSWQEKTSHVYNPDYSRGVVYEPANPVYSPASSLISEESVRNSSPVRYVRCDYCEEEHPDYFTFVCPNKPCTICFEPGHSPGRCPFVEHIPRGANYDRVRYRVVCGCGDLYFDEENWVCTECRGQGTTRLRLKKCSICFTFAHHCTEECPNDKIAAAGHRAIRDYMRLQPQYPVDDADADAALRATREFPGEIARVVRAATEHALRAESGDS